MESKKFICGNCGLIEEINVLKKLIIDDEKKVPREALGIAKILIRNKSYSYQCPECFSNAIFYLLSENQSESKNINRFIEPKKEDVKLENFIPSQFPIEPEIKVPKKRGRKSKKDIIENLKPIDESNDNFINSELEALSDLTGQQRIKIDPEKVKHYLENIKFNQSVPKTHRDPPQLLKLTCDMCKEQFDSKYEATRCKKCIGGGRRR